ALMVTLLLFLTPLLAVDYSEMSTQELIAIMGYTKPANQKKFDYELKSRIKTMTKKEKSAYKKNLEKLQKKKNHE
ncbi:MAG: DUF1104 domain-containing protein, partial [Campylobacterota bacterium]|nr:DUF1104 domain-containing protein [Campylobacterota bacterium]